MATKKKVMKKAVNKKGKLSDKNIRAGIKNIKSMQNELIIRVAPPTTEEITKPIVENNKYMIPANWISEKQIMYLVGKTPKEHVYTRPGKGGQVWHYVTGQYVEKVLNYVFGWNWDFKVVSHGKEGTMVWVLGELTVKNDKGNTITKSQFGRADIKFKKNTKEMLDFGNDLKSATTDALKKCASLFGIASDVYGKTEYKQETGNDIHDEAPADNHNQEQPEYEDHICTVNGCGKDLTDAEAAYSKKIYGKELCREHQKEAKKK